MTGPEWDGQNHDPGIRLVLEELRDLRLEMRTDREDRRRFDEEWRLERRQADEQWRQEKLQSDERFQQLMRQLMRDFREDSARREATTQKAFKDIRAVGLSIVKTLNHHTPILERIERKLGTGGSRCPGQGNGRGT
jgi:hypothetical protein